MRIAPLVLAVCVGVTLVPLALTASSSDARAEPSPYCPGHCSDAPDTPCGEPADCPTPGACVFDDACLPGGAFAIARVVPESETRLNDFLGAWHDEGTPGIVVEDDTLVARLPETEYAQYYAHTFVISPGKQYAVRARMRKDADTTGYLVAYSDTRADYADPLEGDDWQVTALLLGGPLAASGAVETTLAFYGIHAGVAPEGGAVQVADLALLELADDFGQYLRFSLVAPNIDANWQVPLATLIGGPFFYANMPLTPLVAGQPSEWIDMRKSLPGSFVSFGLSFSDADGAPLAPATVRYQVAHRPDDAAIVVDRTVTTGNGSIGIIGTGFPNPLHFDTRLRLIADVVADDPVAFRARPDYAPAPQPDRFGSISGTGWLDMWGSADALVPVLEFWRDLGLNGGFEMSQPALDATLDELGIDFRYLNTGPPFQWLTPSAPYALDTLSAELDVLWDSYPGMQATFERYRSRPEKLVIDMCDEAYGFYFRGDPSYDAGFVDYLKTVALGCADPDDSAKCTPSAFGKSSWDDVHGFTEDEGGIDGARPDMSAGAPDVAAARYFYWRMRWWSEASSRVYAGTRRFYADKLGSDRGIIAPQTGTPFGSYYTWRGGLELQTLAKAGGMQGFLGEAFVSWNDWCWAQQLSLYGDWVDGQVAPYGFTDRGAHVHFTHGKGAQKAFGLAAHGTTLVDWYIYGPHQVTTGDGVAGLGEPSMTALQILQDGSRALALAEPALVETTRVTGPIAIVAAQSDPMWWKATDDLWGYTGAVATDEVGTYLALTHGHHPVRFLIEERLPQDLDASTKVLFIQRRHLRNDAWEAVVRWVEAGGTLILGGELPLADELAQPVAARSEWLGGTFAPLDIWTVPYVARWADDGPAVASAYPRRTLSGGTTLATYDDGGAAAIELQRGSGKVRIVGFLLGYTYTQFDGYCAPSGLPNALGHYPTYHPEPRAAILSLVGDQPRPAWTSQPLVEVVVRERPDEQVLALINYSNAPQPDLAVTAPGFVGTAHAVFGGGDVTFDSDGRATIAMGDVELLVLPRDPVIAEPEPSPEVTPESTSDIGGTSETSDDIGAETTVRTKHNDGCASATPSLAAASLAALLLLARRARRRHSGNCDKRSGVISR